MRSITENTEEKDWKEENARHWKSKNQQKQKQKRIQLHDKHDYRLICNKI